MFFTLAKVLSYSVPNRVAAQLFFKQHQDYSYRAGSGGVGIEYSQTDFEVPDSIPGVY